MLSRDKILAAVKANQPAFTAAPVIENFVQPFTDNTAQYKKILQSIGGNVYEATGTDAIATAIAEQFAGSKRMVTVDPAFAGIAEFYQSGKDAHLLEDVDVAIINAHFGVAENGSVWVTEELLKERVLPFICQHLVAIIYSKHIVATMHEAYDKIADAGYGFGTFIAGPSKTADIEQSLVLGAHGPKTMTVFILGKEPL